MEILDGFDYLDEVQKLFAEYKNFLGLDLSFQPADETPEEIAKRYSNGKIFLARLDSEINSATDSRIDSKIDAKINSRFAGVIAYHPMEDSSNCEFKRFFVRDEFRGFHVGRFLIEHAIDSAREEGYRSIFLDTRENLKSARHLYESLGFEEIPPYYFNPLENVIYYRLKFRGD